MFAYHQNAAVCLVYLDAPSLLEEMQYANARKPYISSNAWLMDAWKLRDLIAPQQVFFFNEEWSFLGTRSTLKKQLVSKTGIPWRILDGTTSLDDVPISSKIKLFRGRNISDPRDLAFCFAGLLGIKIAFDYNEPVQIVLEQMQREVSKTYPELFDSSVFDEITCNFFTAGYIVPPVRWKHQVSKFEIYPKRLVDTKSLQLIDIIDISNSTTQLHYAIMSHVWYGRVDETGTYKITWTPPDTDLTTLQLSNHAGDLPAFSYQDYLEIQRNGIPEEKENEKEYMAII
ncbi:hypothetical protein VKT23_019137 [Stygiomarasmius scandens]|uniref:Uncharacterized protein n=1 Tax=Marasmiellus scandens TaxID=2682957 RepID=A0ABR1IQH5_9AGAR